MDNTSLWSSLGTNGGHIEIVGYRPEWRVIFDKEKESILERCRPWVIEVHHVGSTSVPGLAAKPLLDIMPVVANPDDGEDAVKPMATLGYRYREDNGLPGRFYFDKIVDGRTVVHSHMYPQNQFDVRKLMAFRDHLRSHHEAALAYEGLKRKLASKYRNEREAYTDSKTAFIKCITEAALADSQHGTEVKR